MGSPATTGDTEPAVDGDFWTTLGFFVTVVQESVGGVGGGDIKMKMAWVGDDVSTSYGVGIHYVRELFEVTLAKEDK